MIVFERHASSQSTSTAERTVNPAVRELLRGRFPETGVVGVIAATGWPLIQTFYRRGFRRRAGEPAISLPAKLIEICLPNRIPA